MAISDNPTTRDALRRAVLGDLVDRCAAAAVSIEGGALDGIEVVSLGTLRAQVTIALEDNLPPPSDRRAEVTTPAIVLVSAICPECRLPVEIIVGLSPQLTVDNDGAEIAVKAKSKSRVHVCGQLALAVVGDQESFELEDIIGDDRLDDEDGEANPEGAVLPPDAPEGDGSAASAPSEPCPFPGCVEQAEHQGDHVTVDPDVSITAERLDTIYSAAAERVAAKRAARVKAQGPGFSATQASAAAAELERDLDGPTL